MRDDWLDYSLLENEISLAAHLPPRPATDLTAPLNMDRTTAILEIRTACNQLSSGVTSIHPLLPALGDEPTKAEVIKALFELTKQIETVKKQVMRLEKRDDSGLL